MEGGLNLLSCTLGLVFTYGIAPFIILCSLSPLLGPEHPMRPLLVVASLGFGPISIAWLLSILMLVFPGQSSVLYWLTVVGLFCAAAFVMRKHIPSAWVVLRSIPQVLRPSNISDCILCVLCVFFFLAICLYVVAFPLTDNDPLEYFHLAKIFFNLHTMDIYPIVSGEKTGGFIAPWTHGPGYPALILWHFLIQGHTHTVILGKIISPFYTLCTWASLTFLSHHLRLPFKYAAAFLLFATPLFLGSSFANHIDPLRTYFFLMATVFLIVHLAEERIATAITLGIAIGWGCFVHSSGLLTIALMGGTYLLISQTKRTTRILMGTIIGALCIALILPTLWKNVTTFGHVLGDLSNVEVMRLPNIEIQTFMKFTRGLETPMERTLFGAFKGFFRLKSFGFTHWLMALGVLWGYIYYRKKNKVCSPHFLRDVYPFLLATALPILFFYALMGITTLLDIDVIIKNDRYLLHIQGNAVLLGSLFLGLCKTFHPLWQRQYEQT